MEVMHQRCAGLDVHQRFVAVCRSHVEAGQRHKEIRSCHNKTADRMVF